MTFAECLIEMDIDMDRGSFSNKIAAILLRRQALDEKTLFEAEEACKTENLRLEEYLLRQKLVTETRFTLAVAEYLGLKPVTLAHFTPDRQLLELIPADRLKSLQIIPMSKLGNVLTVALGDPFNTAVVEELQTITGLSVMPLVAAEKEVKDLLQRCLEQLSPNLEDVFKNMLDSDEIQLGDDKEEDVSLDEMLESAEGAPVIRMVNSILLEALRRRASDIHLEPMERSLRLRYRVDGELYEVPSPPKNLQSAITSRIKIMSDMDIAERRVPQDGRFKIRALGREVDLRVNLLPMIHGEKIVMRLLDKSNLASSLSALGLDPKAHEALLYSISQPHGIILVTGPTGSGKTTTLYSCLQDLNKVNVNIVTTEDPVEYQLQGINQVQINEDVGLTFASALRAILRQDPDIVMVGEIRDQETAAIAVKAALTGHLVLSTLHTNDAAGAITRMRDMGIEAFLLASSIIMAQAQRLYKKLCVVCKKPAEISENFLRINNIDPAVLAGSEIYAPVGCSKCANTGFRGRSSLMEVLIINDEMRQLILANANAGALTEKAIAAGMQTLRMVGLDKVKQGISSLEEILSVTGSAE